MIETDAYLDSLEGGAWYQAFPLRKAPKVFRVAILGGSTVKAFRNAKLLQQRLVESGIADRVEVLNFGVCGCGTDRAVVSARQALQLDVDAILLYSGHNEFISESNYKTYQQPGWLHRHSRLIQLCAGDAWQAEPGRLYTEQEKETVYARLRENLREIRAMARKADVLLIWGTVASSLTAPLVPYTRGLYDLSELPEEPNKEFNRGLELLAQGHYEDAKEKLQRAIADCPRPWRATWRTNLILRETAEELAVPLADVERRAYEVAPHGIPGQDMFYDYCHLHARSNPVVLEALAEVLIREVERESGGSEPAPEAKKEESGPPA
jgi:hypothetical protein